MRTVWFFIGMVLFPLLIHAATLININTANATLLDTLPGIGPSKAAAIVQYRTDHGLFARIQDIQNVSGIGPSIYADIAPLITVGDINTSNANASSTPSDTYAATSTTNITATTTVQSSNSGPPEYLPIPTLHIVAGGNRTVSSGADTAFTATVYDGKGNKRNDAVVTWSFGDGMYKTGASVFHRYYYSGEYVAVVHATTSDGGDEVDEMVITVKNAGIKIVSISSRGITLLNNDSRTLDLSFWKLSMGGQEFKIPENTQILAGRTVLFPLQVIELPISDSASLLYPSGEVAFAYPEPVSGGQPLSNSAGYGSVQVVEPIISAETVPTYEKAVNAPAAATEVAAAGAAVPSPTLAAATPPVGATDVGTVATLFRSPWTLGFLGTVILAGAAFILI